MSSYSNADAAVALAVVASLGIIIFLFLAILATYLIICQWFLFKKAGLPGWYSLIPFYNQYHLFKMCWKAKYYFIYLALSLGTTFISTDSAFGTLFSFFVSIAVLVFTAILLVHLSKAFGYSGFFALGLFFFSPIFLGIMAFSKSQYVGNSKYDNMTQMYQ